MALGVDDIPAEESKVEKGKKKHSIKATVLDSFTLLANNSDSTRINGGLKLLSYLFTNNDAEETEKEAKYALSRLVRGIATNRPGARQGFFTTLTVYLANQTHITITSLVALLNKELQVGGQSKSETGELCTGHVLVCGAVLRSGLFARSTDEERAQVLTMMFSAANRKTYLGLVAYSFIVDFINNGSEEDVTEKLWPHLKEHLSKPMEEHTLDSLYCLLVTAARFPALSKKIVKKKLGFPALLCPETVTVICTKLMNAPDFPSVHHPIYETFGKELSKSEHLVLFWNTLETKLSLRNQNRSIIALTILDSILKNITDHSKEIPHLFSDKFIPNILEWFKGFKSASLGGKLKKYRGKQQRYEDEEENDGRKVVLKAKDVFDTLVDVLKKEAIEKVVSFEVLKKLTFYPGDIMFGEITNSKIIKSLTEELNSEGVKELADILKKVISNESRKVQGIETERPWTNSERLRAAEMYAYLVNHKSTAENIKWRIKKMQFLLRVSLFKTSGPNETAATSTELAAAVKKCFFRCLNYTLPKLETLLKVLTALVDYTDECLSDEANLKLTKAISPKTLESWKMMRKFTKKLVASADSDSSKANTVFQILSLHSGLFLFADVMSEEMAGSSLQEVKSCYDHYIQDRKGGKKKKVESKEGEIVDEEPEWIEVLVDVFLNFLSRDSSLLRSVVQCVFRLLCEYLTPSAIGQLVSVLDPDSDTNPLSHHGDQSDDEDDASASEEDNQSDGNDEDAGKEDNDDEDESSEDEDADDHTTVTDQLRMAVQKALGSAAPETDTESLDADNIGEEEGKKLDEALSNAFKMLKQSKGKKSKKDKKNDKVLMNFRIRVLDLIDIYLEKEPSMELCLGMLSPLSRCLEFSIKDSDQVQLETKVRRCLKSLTAVKTFSSMEGVTSELLAEYLRAVTNRGGRTQFVFQALGDVVSKCSTFIVRCELKIKPTETPSKKKKKHKPCPIAEIYKESLSTFFTKRDCLLPVILFHEVLQLTWEGNWQILPLIIEYSFTPSVRQFRKNEGLEMINMFYKNLKRNLRTESAQEISAKLKPLEEKLSEQVLTSFRNDPNLNERFFTILMKLFNTIKNFHSSVKESTDNMSWNEIKTVLQERRENIKLKNMQVYNKFCALFGLQKIKNKVVDTDKKQEEKVSTDSGHDSNTDDASEDKQQTKKDKKLKKKQKHNGVSENGVASDDEHESKERRQVKRVRKEISKKEAKQLRAQASAEGLQVVSFSNLLANNIDVDDIGEQSPDSDDNKHKKRKQPEDTRTKKKVKMIS